MLLLVRVVGTGKCNGLESLWGPGQSPEDHLVFEVERITLQQVVPGKPDWYQVNSDKGLGHPPPGPGMDSYCLQ